MTKKQQQDLDYRLVRALTAILPNVYWSTEYGIDYAYAATEAVIPRDGSNSLDITRAAERLDGIVERFITTEADYV